jgi:hypothetical protein
MTTVEYTKAGILTAVCADILNDDIDSIINAEFRMAPDVLYTLADRLAVVRDTLARLANDEGVPDDMIFKKGRF